MRPTSPVTASAIGVLAKAVFTKPNHVVAALVAGLGLMAWFTLPTETVQIRWVVVGAIILTYLLWLSLVQIQQLMDKSPSIPKVLTIVEGAEPRCPIFLLEPSEWYGYASIVSIYFKIKENGLEVFVGRGYVHNIQADMKIQVQLEYWEQGTDKYQNIILNKEDGWRESIYVKPSIARSSGRELRLENVELFAQIIENLRNRNQAEVPGNE